MVTYDAARQCILLHNLSDETLERVLALGREEVYKEGDTLVRQGEHDGKVFVLLEGMARVQVATMYGNNQALVYLGPGQLIGEIALVDGGPHSATVEVVQTPTRVLTFERDALLALCDENPRLGYQLMRNIAADLGFKMRHHNLSVV